MGPSAARLKQVVALLAILPLLAACSSALAPEVAPKPDGAPLSQDKISKAEAIVRVSIANLGPSVLSATVVDRPGRPRHAVNSSPGSPCSSGRELQIKLIGHFPRWEMDHLPALPGSTSGPDFTALVTTADAESGQPCRLKALTGVQQPQPGGFPLVFRGQGLALLHPFAPLGLR